MSLTIAAGAVTDPAVAHRRYPALNAVRAIAASGVVATHVGFQTGKVDHGHVGGVIARMDFGVALFFVLSGFLLGRPYFQAMASGRPRPGTRRYLWKRALRILPLYWLTVVAALLVLPTNRNATTGQWLHLLSLTQVYSNDVLVPGLTQMWSLCTEVAFYFILPALTSLIASVAARSEFRPHRALAVIAGLGMAGVGWVAGAAVWAPGSIHLAMWLPGYLLWFAVGLGLALASTTTWSLFDRVGRDLVGCWVLAFSLYVIATTPVAGPRLLFAPTAGEAVVKHLAYAAVAGLVVWPLVARPDGGPVHRLLSRPILWWLGEVSYGIFCVHLIVLVGAMRLLGVHLFDGHFGSVLALTWGGSVLLSFVAYAVLERPLMRLKRLGTRNVGGERMLSPASARASSTQT
jgi:peptidoglycan/LPS O-acetylase OafA/YrhL